MDIAGELAELLAALEAVNDRVEQWESLHSGGRSPSVSGDGPNAHEERSIRHAAATMARVRAREVREELAAVRARTRRAAEQAAAPGRAHGAVHETPREGSASALETVADTLHRAAADLVVVENGDQAMERIVASALHVAPLAEWGGMCVQEGAPERGRGSGVSVHAASDPLVERLEMVQARDDEGPCVDALATGVTITSPDLLDEQRWPRFRRAAQESGVRSVLAVGLPVAPPGGVLTLYSSHHDAFDDATRVLIEVFADHAAIALAGARRVGALRRAIDTRDLVGQAKGYLMHQHGVTADRAFALLVEASQHSNLKLVDVATWVVGGMPDAVGSPPDATPR